MPSTRIATGCWACGHEIAIIEAVQSALSKTLELPYWDRDIVLDCYDDRRRIVPLGRSERFTRIEIILFAGRTLDAKRKLYKEIVGNLQAIGVPPEETKIVLIEAAAENWGIRGGIPASEVELGFRIHV